MIRLVLPLRPVRASLHRHHSLDHCRALRLARPRTAEVLHHTPLALDAAHDLSRARTEPAVAPRVLAQLFARLQRPDARSHPPLLPTHRIRRCDSRMDSSRLLVLFEYSWRPRWSRRPQRWQGEHSGCKELVGTMVISRVAAMPTRIHRHHRDQLLIATALRHQHFCFQRHMTWRNCFDLSFRIGMGTGYAWLLFLS
jgi:hypothetical protein